ncbi:FeoA family protein [Clostridium sp. Marseille-P3244]|uniref:FeoA family protein n=1 Tax=Clostridium sp. Marseille-P3244 TaxID=1871020 RepID=UPI0009300659|nr:FeoA family protein [Clostridium sp. Marseille-P3244]
MQALSNVKAGETCTIKWMFGLPEVIGFLRSRQVEEGSTVRVIQQCRDSVIIGVQDRRLALGSEVAERIKV